MSQRPPLHREVHTFTQYLVGTRPTPYVVERYAAGHGTRPELAGAARFDHWHVRLASLHPALCRGCDAFARFGAPHGLLRKKLVLLLAILEISPPFASTLDRSQRPLVLELSLVVAEAAVFTMAAILGTVLCFPVRIIAAVVPSRT